MTNGAFYNVETVSRPGRLLDQSADRWIGYRRMGARRQAGNPSRKRAPALACIGLTEVPKRFRRGLVRTIAHDPPYVEGNAMVCANNRKAETVHVNETGSRQRTNSGPGLAGGKKRLT